MDVYGQSTLIASTLRNRLGPTCTVHDSFNFHLISRMSSNEMQLDMLVWLLLLFFLRFHESKQANCQAKE